MSDRHLRELERRFRETGGVGDEAELLKERMRCGRLPLEALEAAAYLGHAAALSALGRAPELHSRLGRIEDVAFMLDENQQQAWVGRCVERALTTLVLPGSPPESLSSATWLA